MLLGAWVYLTNTLTGWGPAEKPKTMLMFPKLKKEQEAADVIRLEQAILVILGNLPYSKFAGVVVEEESELTDAYQSKSVVSPGIGAERRVGTSHHGADRARHSVLYQQFSWLNGLLHLRMRERYLEAFDKVMIDSLNGDKYKTSKTTPEGKPAPS